jgi:hypothetical protein
MIEFHLDSAAQWQPRELEEMIGFHLINAAQRKLRELEGMITD